MTLSTAWLDELRARTVLSAVISPSVKLLRAGREWKACCPFHNEKTPSFTVNDDKGFYHCFGCGAHGDAIRFLTDHRRIEAHAFEGMENFTKGIVTLFYYAGVLSAKLQEMPDVGSCRQEFCSGPVLTAQTQYAR